MGEYTNYTKQQLQEKANELVSEYEEYKEVVSQAYDAMMQLSEEYNKIIKEIENK